MAGCEEPPTVWAKLVTAPLLGRGLLKPVLPIGTPPPKAHVPPLLARIAGAPVSTFQISTQGNRGAPYPSSPLAVVCSIRFCFAVLVAGLESRLVCRVRIEVRQLEDDNTQSVQDLAEEEQALQDEAEKVWVRQPSDGWRHKPTNTPGDEIIYLQSTGAKVSFL